MDDSMQSNDSNEPESDYPELRVRILTRIRQFFDRWMRVLHLYTSMMLVPWVLVYALSGLMLSHPHWFAKGWSSGTLRMVREGVPFLPDDTFFQQSRDQQARAVLRQVGMEGDYQISGAPFLNSGDQIIIGGDAGKGVPQVMTPGTAQRKPDDTMFLIDMTIVRLSASGRSHVVWHPRSKTIDVLQEQFAVCSWLRNLHFKAGYSGQTRAWWPNLVWSVMVDTTMVALVFWCLSGFWMWFRRKRHRLLSGIGLLVGVGVFLWFSLHI